MGNFITNSEQKRLGDRLVTLISQSKELKFLVGFFYFSGINELYESLKSNQSVQLRVLVGLEVDKGVFGVVEHGNISSELSNDEVVSNFLSSTRKSINAEAFDTQQFYEQVRFFIDLMKSGRLAIRKTLTPNHAKLYIFKLNEGQVGRSELFITGSSNLTRAGMTTQEEFNVEISDHGVEDANKYFDDLWSASVQITEVQESRDKLIAVIEGDTHIAEITPFEAFVLTLKTYLESFPEGPLSKTLEELLERRGYVTYAYQLDAVRQALGIIGEYGGVIIADVVGLGKSVIAGMIGHELNTRGLIICPPGLMGDRNKKSGWSKYADEFGMRDWEIRSLGDLEKTLEYVQQTGDIQVVIVDEAHRFRNEQTKDYELLKNICRGKKVILLTATPFNNSPDDVLALLQLFITPKKSGITLENDLKSKFRSFKGVFDKLAFIRKNYLSIKSEQKSKALAYYEGLFGEKSINIIKTQERAKFLAREIRDVIEPITIRRNRLDLLNHPDYQKEVKELSRIADPEEWFFELTPEQSAFYERVISEYFSEEGSFTGAIYRPYLYEEGGSEEGEADGKVGREKNFQRLAQKNLYEFMRRLLVKRFESSFGSFEQSLKNFVVVHEKIQKFIEKSNGKYVLKRKFLEQMLSKTEDEIEEAIAEYAASLDPNSSTIRGEKVYDVNTFAKKDEFLGGISSDIQLFKAILKEIDDLDLVKNDPKSECIIPNIKKVLDISESGTKRKVVIFTEYNDTAKYLQPKLEKVFGKRVLTIGSDLSQSKIGEMVANFDAAAKEQKDDYDILLASDRVSEGFNLNRAGMIINYDIPWNPVRVIQRVGRINRISKKVFDELRIVNFFPSERGADIVRSRQIASHKMYLIHNTLGEDSKIFEAGEEPSEAGLFQKLKRNPDELEEESFSTKAAKYFRELEKSHPDVLSRVSELPARVKVAKNADEYALIVFIRKGRIYVRHAVPNEEDWIVSHRSYEEVFDLIKCEPSTPRMSLTGDKFWAGYSKVREYKEESSAPLGDVSLESRALNSLSSILRLQPPELIAMLSFLRLLREDIVSFGTLSKYTLGRISDWGDVPAAKSSEDIQKLYVELGQESYLKNEKMSSGSGEREVIIAIENRTA